MNLRAYRGSFVRQLLMIFRLYQEQHDHISGSGCQSGSVTECSVHWYNYL